MKARRIYQEYGLDLIVVDYLQLMQGENSGGRPGMENRVQEISYISRALKQIARELKVPLIAGSQLSRMVEQRSDKRPMLSDLRESGCLSGDMLITLSKTGQRLPIRDLVGKASFSVWSLNEQNMKCEPATVSRVFSTGVKPVFTLTTRLGRSIKATANHPFRAFEGWKRLDQLQIGERIAMLRELSHENEQTLSDAQLALLGHLIGDGCTLPTHAVQYTTVQSESLMQLANSDVYWDEILSIEPCGEEEVFDMTVPEHHNFVANDIVVHNSIEQDSDIVTFIYRDELYNPDTDQKNIAEISVQKNRNGPTGKINLFFDKRLTSFKNLARERIEL